MHYCSACQTAIASIVILDLDGGAVTGSQHLCQACAEKLGIAQPKPPSKFAAEALEDLLSGLGAPKPSERQRAAACPGCGMTPQDFRSKGRLGCPRCYEAFRGDLVPLLLRIHESQRHRGRLPGRVAEAPPPDDGRSLTRLRKQLDDAVRSEHYEEAARLRDDLRRLEHGEGATS
jgi:protein arginine kinase activator